MQIDPQSTSIGSLYHWLIQLITPRPIAWVSTVSSSGIANLAPFSFFNGVGANPPTVVFCPANRRDGTPKDTLANIHQTGQFVVNIVTEAFITAMDDTSASLSRDEDEFLFAKVAKAESEKVSPPRVAQCAASLECKLHTVIQLGSGPAGANLVIGKIVWIHVDDGLLGQDGKLDSSRLDTVGRMGGEQYVRTNDRFELPKM